MNDFFAGDSDVIEVLQRSKAQRELARHTDILEDNRRLGKARLREEQEQTKILKQEALAKKRERETAELHKQYLQTTRKTLIDINASLSAIARTEFSQDCQIDINAIRSFSILATAADTLNKISSENRLYDIDDLEFLGKTKAHLNKLYNQDFEYLTSFLSTTVNVISDNCTILLKAAEELINDVSRTLNTISDEQSLVIARDTLKALHHDYAKLISTRSDCNSNLFLELYKNHAPEFKPLISIFSIRPDAIIGLQNHEQVFDNILRLKMGSLDIYHCTYSDIENADQLNLQKILSDLNSKSAPGIESAKLLFTQLIMSYDNIDELRQLIKSCEYSVYVPSLYACQHRDTLADFANELVTLNKSKTFFKRLALRNKVAEIKPLLASVSSEIVKAGALDASAAIQCSMFIESNYYAGLIKMVNSIIEAIRIIEKCYYSPKTTDIWGVLCATTEGDQCNDIHSYDYFNASSSISDQLDNILLKTIPPSIMVDSSILTANNYSVELVKFGDVKFNTLAEIGSCLGCGTIEAINLTKTIPVLIKKMVSKKEAEWLVMRLQANGTMAVLRSTVSDKPA